MGLTLYSNLIKALRQVFGVLLPGAVAAAIGYYYGQEQLKGLAEAFAQRAYQLDLMFFVVAYIIGHGIVLIGHLIDSLVYDKLKWRFYSKKSLEAVKEFRQADYRQDVAKPLVSIFDWSYDKLMKGFPVAISEINRKLANN